MTEVVITNVDFGYSEDHIVLHDINLEINEPGLYCIIGPNGVGKSTMVKCVSKIVTPLKGQVLLDGEDVAQMQHKEVAKKVGFVPAFSQDAFSMSVIDTIMIGRYNHQKWGSRQKDLEMVYKTMKLMHIENLATRSYNALSAGQHQKVSIARGLVQEPEILILDEPTAKLDVKYQVYVMEMLRAIAIERGMIIMTICHDLNISSKYAHTVIMLARPGTIHAVGTPEEVLTEENIREVYGINCRVFMDDTINKPYIILGSAIMGMAEDY
ncbi:MAG: ABC transporter ATP-binding protein [Candidatus Methanomethylophilaceae archaeon]|nr:ABC transporter ATP-binding protein [Candidatus Methanomethylophilaceae archaeon]